MQKQHTSDVDFALSPVDRLRVVQIFCLRSKTKWNLDSHAAKMFRNAFKNVILVRVRVVDAWRIQNHNGLSANISHDDADIAGTRLEPIANTLQLRRDEIDKLFVLYEVSVYERHLSQCQHTVDFPEPDCPKILREVQRVAQ